MISKSAHVYFKAFTLFFILGVAVIRSDVRVRRYAIPLACAGAIISVYHYQLERFPSQGSFSCTLDVPCSVTLFTRLGFVSIPWMALSAFALIVVLLGAARVFGRWTPHAVAAATSAESGENAIAPGVVGSRCTASGAPDGNPHRRNA